MYIFNVISCAVIFLLGYVSVGCYKDTGSRAIPTLEGNDFILDGSYSSRTNAIAKCAVAAMKRGYRMFALEWWSVFLWCYCSSDLQHVRKIYSLLEGRRRRTLGK